MNASPPSLPPSAMHDLPLRGYHFPDPVSWWPPAPGWWIILGSAVLLLFAGAFFLRHYRRQQWRRDALSALDVIGERYKRTGNTHDLAEQLSIFLRRVCLTRFPDDSGTHLTGEQWLGYLDAVSTTRRGDQALFLTPLGRQLLETAYNPAADVDASVLLRACRTWVRSLPAQPTWRKNGAA